MTRSRSPSWRTGSVDLSRRRHLLALSACATTASLATGRAVAQTACALADNAGEGPFYFDPSLVRSDIRDDRPGAPLTIAIQVTRASDCATLAAARVDLWQADAIGLYSGYENQRGVGGVDPSSAAGRSYLRGTQLTDGDGWVRFTTIFPSWYGGRTPHLHFKVFVGTDEVVASQLFFPDATSAYVFEHWEPYASHAAKRTTFNDNDPLQQGVYCDVARADETGVDASVVVGVETA